MTRIGIALASKYQRRNFDLLQRILPQNPTRRLTEDELNTVWSDVKGLLVTRKDCEDFINALLKQVAINTGRDAVFDLTSSGGYALREA